MARITTRRPEEDEDDIIADEAEEEEEEQVSAPPVSDSRRRRQLKRGEIPVTPEVQPARKERNYTSQKNRRNDTNRLEFKKYCKRCRKHTLHRETK